MAIRFSGSSARSPARYRAGCPASRDGGCRQRRRGGRGPTTRHRLPARHGTGAAHRATGFCQGGTARLFAGRPAVFRRPGHRWQPPKQHSGLESCGTPPGLFASRKRQPPCRGRHQRTGKARSAVSLGGDCGGFKHRGEMKCQKLPVKAPWGTRRSNGMERCRKPSILPGDA